MPKPNRYDDRESSSERGYGYKWQKAREAYLKKHPLCVQHSHRGLIEKAIVVDHIIPHRLNEALKSGDLVRIEQAKKLFWERSNWQSLCKLCHDSWKQRLEKSGKDSSCDTSGIPTNPNHHWNK